MTLLQRGAESQGKEEADGQQGRGQPKNGDRQWTGRPGCRGIARQGPSTGKDSAGRYFVVLLKGLYQPVTHGPNFGLSAVDLSDGSYSTTKIYPVSGTPGNTNLNEAIGDFYVQFEADLCAYHIPGGSFAMRFTGSNVAFEPDGAGGRFLAGTFELDVIEGTGIYRSVVGGHNHMVDRLHFLAPGDGSGGVDEFCFCFISGP